MKKIILGPFLLLVVLLARGQEYVPLIDTTRTWNVANIYPHGGGANTIKYIYGDVLHIEDTLYVEVLAKYIDGSSYESVEAELMGYLRENTQSRKVYYRNIFAQEPALLYDFSLKKGENINLFGYPFNHTVSHVDSVELLNGDFRKRMVLFSNSKISDSVVWIEGIGNTTIDLLNPGQSDVGTITTKLLCSYENEELVYMNNTFSSCYLGWVPIEDFPESTIKITHNLLQDQITIEGKSDSRLIVNIYNLQGQLLLFRHIKNYDTIDISRLNPGLIVVRVTEKNNSVSIFKTMKL
jgi:hypothetical protein